MHLKRLFTKSEAISLIVIFTILILIAVPNFGVSLRRSRDQVRRDDLGALHKALEDFNKDLRKFPQSSSDGKILACLAPGYVPTKDAKGNWIINYVACNWGTDAFTDVISGKKYMSLLPRDPDWQRGVSYIYKSNGHMYQLFASMEGMDEAEVDPAIIARNISCGSRICNVGRSFNCDTSKTLEQCVLEENLLKK